MQASSICGPRSSSSSSSLPDGTDRLGARGPLPPRSWPRSPPRCFEWSRDDTGSIRDAVDRALERAGGLPWLSWTCADLTRVFAGRCRSTWTSTCCVESGNVHALVGLNGAGKTTLMRLLLGMLHPDSGTVRFGGMPARRPPAQSDWSPGGSPGRTPARLSRAHRAHRTLALAARLHGADPTDRCRPRSSRHPRRAEAGEATPTGGCGCCPRETSSGSGWPSPCSTHPQVVVLDEPTNGLDPSGVVLLREALLEAGWPRAPRCWCRATTSTRSPGSPTRSRS